MPMDTWSRLLVEVWWRYLGVDVLMTGPMARQMRVARALLEHEEGSDYAGYDEEREEREEEDFEAVEEEESDEEKDSDGEVGDEEEGGGVAPQALFAERT